MLAKLHTAKSVLDQLVDFKKTKKILSSRIEKFVGVDGWDVYNPSVPFVLEGKTYIAGRVEQRNNEISHIRFFESAGDGVWQLVPNTTKLPLQDPCITFVDGGILLGGVMLNYDDNHRVTDWQMDFYFGKDLYSLEHLFSGPKEMKDIRLLQLSDGRIAVFTRPNGSKISKKYGCICKVGFCIVPNLNKLNADLIQNAPFVEGLFIDSEWGGANSLLELENGLIGVVGHKSCRTSSNGKDMLHYYGICFAINPDSRERTPTEVIIARDCFPEAAAKRPDLVDVTFTAGIIRNSDGTATVYTGLSDVNVGCAVIPDPMLKYEKIKVCNSDSEAVRADEGVAIASLNR